MTILNDRPVKKQTVIENCMHISLLLVDRDSSGIRFYVGNQLRQYDIGYLTSGIDPSPSSIAIPPQVGKFVVDSYCPVNASVVRMPNTISSFDRNTNSFL